MQTFKIGIFKKRSIATFHESFCQRQEAPCVLRKIVKKNQQFHIIDWLESEIQPTTDASQAYRHHIRPTFLAKHSIPNLKKSKKFPNYSRWFVNCCLPSISIFTKSITWLLWPSSFLIVSNVLPGCSWFPMKNISSAWCNPYSWCSVMFISGNLNESNQSDDLFT